MLVWVAVVNIWTHTAFLNLVPTEYSKILAAEIVILIVEILWILVGLAIIGYTPRILQTTISASLANFLSFLFGVAAPAFANAPDRSYQSKTSAVGIEVYFQWLLLGVMMLSWPFGLRFVRSWQDSEPRLKTSTFVLAFIFNGVLIGAAFVVCTWIFSPYLWLLVWLPVIIWLLASVITLWLVKKRIQ